MKKICKRCGAKGEVKEVIEEATLKIISTDKVGMCQTFLKSGPGQYRNVWVCAKCAKEIEEAKEKEKEELWNQKKGG